jgi:pyruvate/2-oxoglutarate dehydrogenase complex dihydrolipoamide acyltransferase (E2) component
VDLHSGARSPFSFVDLPRCRRNVLDMIELAGRQTVPVPLFYDVDVTWVEKLRHKFASFGFRTTITAILLKAIAIAQRAHPLMRTALLPTGHRIVLNRICAGLTIERFVNGEPGVFFGSIQEPDNKPILEIAKELRSFAVDEVVEHPELQTQDWFNNVPWLVRHAIIACGMVFPPIRMRYMSATFGVTSLGKFGVKALVPPCVTASTFGVGAVEDRPIAINGKVEIRPFISLVLTFDHRIVDGGPAARFMQDVIHLLQGGLEEYVRPELDKLASKAKQASSRSSFVLEPIVD